MISGRQSDHRERTLSALAKENHNGSDVKRIGGEESDQDPRGPGPLPRLPLPIPLAFLAVLRVRLLSRLAGVPQPFFCSLSSVRIDRSRERTHARTWRSSASGGSRWKRATKKRSSAAREIADSTGEQ